MDQFEIDELIKGALSNQPPNAAFRQRLKDHSMQAFVRGRASRLWYRRVALVCVVTLMTVGAFMIGQQTRGGRSSDGRVSQGDRVVVSRDLVTWLEAGRFFGRLGMPERESRAYQQASRLASEQGHRALAAGSDRSVWPVIDSEMGNKIGRLLARCDAAVDEQMDQSRQGRNRIMAQVSGGLNNGR
jgi:hypothetical protein